VKIHDVMTPDIEVVGPDETLRTAAQLMADHDLPALPVRENDRLVGIITAQDIAKHVVAKDANGDEIAVREAMSADVLYCFESEKIDDVSQKMSEWWVCRLPVVNRDKCVIGTVSLADLTAPKAAPERGESTKFSPRLSALPLPRQPRRLPKAAA
jgi:CBS domain-containing protein